MLAAGVRPMGGRALPRHRFTVRVSASASASITFDEGRPVVLRRKGGAEIHLIGTNHKSSRSEARVEVLLAHVQPSIVFVEVCEERAGKLVERVKDRSLRRMLERGVEPSSLPEEPRTFVVGEVVVSPSLESLPRGPSVRPGDVLWDTVTDGDEDERPEFWRAELEEDRRAAESMSGGKVALFIDPGAGPLGFQVDASGTYRDLHLCRVRFAAEGDPPGAEEEQAQRAAGDFGGGDGGWLERLGIPLAGGTGEATGRARIKAVQQPMAWRLGVEGGGEFCAALEAGAAMPRCRAVLLGDQSAAVTGRRAKEALRAQNGGRDALRSPLSLPPWAQTVATALVAVQAALVVTAGDAVGGVDAVRPALESASSLLSPPVAAIAVLSLSARVMPGVNLRRASVRPRLKGEAGEAVMLRERDEHMAGVLWAAAGGEGGGEEGAPLLDCPAFVAKGKGPTRRLEYVAEAGGGGVAAPEGGGAVVAVVGQAHVEGIVERYVARGGSVALSEAAAAAVR